MTTDLHCSHGPVSSMPGSSHDLPPGTMCDRHGDTPAVRRVQGETDSFGAEYHCMCQKCYDEYLIEINSPEARSGYCDWCKGLVTDLANLRDPDEGMAGPVYRVCGPCRDRHYKRLAAELDEDDNPYYDHDDSGECGCDRSDCADCSPRGSLYGG